LHHNLHMHRAVVRVPLQGPAAVVLQLELQTPKVVRLVVLVLELLQPNVLQVPSLNYSPAQDSKLCPKLS
jgi:hypothetical protein